MILKQMFSLSENSRYYSSNMENTGTLSISSMHLLMTH